MKLRIPAPWEDFVRQQVDAGRYKSASEVVHAALKKLQETEDEIFSAGFLKHLYTQEENAAEAKLAKCIRVPEKV